VDEHASAQVCTFTTCLCARMHDCAYVCLYVSVPSHTRTDCAACLTHSTVNDEVRPLVGLVPVADRMRVRLQTRDTISVSHPLKPKPSTRRALAAALYGVGEDRKTRGGANLAVVGAAVELGRYLQRRPQMQCRLVPKAPRKGGRPEERRMGKGAK
jgi:hypothetical protein